MERGWSKVVSRGPIGSISVDKLHLAGPMRLKATILGLALYLLVMSTTIDRPDSTVLSTVPLACASHQCIAQFDSYPSKRTHPLGDPSAQQSSLPLDLRYVVNITDPQTHMIHIQLGISNLDLDSVILTFSTNAGVWTGGLLSPEKNVRNLIARGGSGQILDLKVVDDGIPWTGDGIEISTRNEEKAIVDYDVKIGFQIGQHEVRTGYLDSEFGVVEPEFIFYTPVRVDVGSVTVLFELPDDWIPVSHWRSEGYKSWVDFQSGELTAGALGFGKYTVRTSVIDAVKVTVATHGLDPSETERATNNVFSLFDYYTRTLGPAPVQGYIVIFIPGKVSGYAVSPYNEQSYGYFSRQQEQQDRLYWAIQAHQIFHQWNGGTMGGVQWFQEGFTNYYELRASQSLGILTYSEVNREFCRKFGAYSDIVGTKNDMSVQDASIAYNTASEEERKARYSFLVYEKGSLVAYLLNSVITDVTNGTRNIDDVTRYLYETKRVIESGDILEASNIVAGYNFTSFFSHYVFGNERLPMLIKNEMLVVDWSHLPILEKLPKDSDRDGLTDDEEGVYGTDPNNRDSDGDGRFDGEEVHGYRTIFIDGARDDWDGIKPLWLDDQNDMQYKAPNSDLKSLTMSFDGENLYFMIQLYDGKPSSDDSYDLMFDLNSDQSHDYTFNCYPRGFVDRWDLTKGGDPGDYLENPLGVEISSDDVLEVEIPLDLIGNARIFSLASHIMVFSVETENDLFIPRWVDVSLDALFPLQKTDPLDPDTDGDGVYDGADPHPLDPKPETASGLISKANVAITRAEQERRNQGLDTARQRLNEAKSAYNSGEYDLAASEAQEALRLAENATSPTTATEQTAALPAQSNWLRLNWAYLVGLAVIIVIGTVFVARRLQSRPQ